MGTSLLIIQVSILDIEVSGIKYLDELPVRTVQCDILYCEEDLTRSENIDESVDFSFCSVRYRMATCAAASLPSFVGCA